MKKINLIALVLITAIGFAVASPTVLKAESESVNGNSNNTRGSTISGIGQNLLNTNGHKKLKKVRKIKPVVNSINNGNATSTINRMKSDNDSDEANEHAVVGNPFIVSSTTPPTILFATNIGLQASTTEVIFVTNRITDGKIWVSTSPLISTSTTPTLSSSVQGFFHMFQIPNLATSTQYYFTLSGTDSSGNIGYLIGNSFTTPSI